MREAIGGTWLLGLALTFIVFFASFLAVSINYAKAFNVKNSIVDLITKYEGNNCDLSDTSYLVTGTCGDGYNGYNLNGTKVASGKKAYYCVSDKESTGDSTTISKNFYRVTIFFKIDLPLMGDIAFFKIKGETESIYFPTDEATKDC